MDMKKNILLGFITLFLTLIAIEGMLRSIGMEPAHAYEQKHVFKISPDSLIVVDKKLGWHLGTGTFSAYINNDLLFTCFINNRSNRVTQLNLQDTDVANQALLPKIFILGCSFTFGFSVPDSAAYPFLLQNTLPRYAVQNLGVPGYGLIQMYLSLKSEVEKGNKPNIVVVNYAKFHDERGALGLNWLRAFDYGQLQHEQKRHLQIDYPFGYLVNEDSLTIAYCKQIDWAKDFPLRNTFALVDLINTAYDNWKDERNEKIFVSISLHCACKISNYCRQNNIKLLFYGLDKEAKPLLDSLSKKGNHTLLSTVEIWKEELNCSPLDPGHPNAKAHQIYAHEVLAFMQKNKLLE